MSKKNFSLLSLFVSLAFAFGTSISTAASSPAQHETQSQNELLHVSEAPFNRGAIKSEIRTTYDVAYGKDVRQRFDVYAPLNAKNAPVIFMVHGGGWARGDKASRDTIENKIARWAPRGFILISTNYRMLPDTPPMEQAKDVARAIAAAQEQVTSWGGNREKFILMGHSAGAHLVTLLSVSSSLKTGLHLTPWLGTVSLDSAAIDVVAQMESRHVGLYDRAFGRDPAYWPQVSPHHVLNKPVAPIFVVCSSKRSTSCSHATNFVTKAHSLGMRSTLLPQNLSHKDINQRLGEEGAYTDAVDAFLFSLIK